MTRMVMVSRRKTDKFLPAVQLLLAMAASLAAIGPAAAQHTLGVPFSHSTRTTRVQEGLLSNEDFVAILATIRVQRFRPFPRFRAAQPPTICGNRLGTRGITRVPETDAVLAVAAFQAHSNCYQRNPYPSAEACGKCHPKHYREWSVSPHAYAQLSPVFGAFQNAAYQLQHGTQGDFCIRCHTPIGMALQEPIGGSNLNRHPTSREGITCVVCHRINQPNGRGSGRISLVAGGTHQVVYGTLGNRVIEQVVANPEKYGVLKTEREESIRGQEIHQKSYQVFSAGNFWFLWCLSRRDFPTRFSPGRCL